MDRRCFDSDPFHNRQISAEPLLGQRVAGSAYGAAGSLITLLLWVFYSAQILLFDGEFTKVYASTYGPQVEPQEHAVRVERKEIELPPH